MNNCAVHLKHNTLNQLYFNLKKLFRKVDTRKDICTSTFIAALITTAKRWKQSKYPSTDKWINNICIQWNIIYSYKGNSETCYNTNEP